ncbi:uncharacterized protein K460DRAFT_410268 [Cucurbitaria berberidis CBS 394.84]|uniref:Uncharacterized protein n=1 Tax=Cucurbitaria berberidis CBS 394.84 TaxID=1168544 RepID=A0A9P4G8A2_9PLEO|nr:uncharacterized protein K460DRAFT_410268 [Cucurbitaria berberidis CBS 394.84]KAF1840871.1 hypothetical protein K460DRAFT_410268 [Cucurbitaria berberidis CBS 394.84]
MVLIYPDNVCRCHFGQVVGIGKNFCGTHNGTENLLIRAVCNLANLPPTIIIPPNTPRLTGDELVDICLMEGETMMPSSNAIRREEKVYIDYESPDISAYPASAKFIVRYIANARTKTIRPMIANAITPRTDYLLIFWVRAVIKIATSKCSQASIYTIVQWLNTAPTINENQQYNVKLSETQTSQMIKFAVTLPKERWAAVQAGVRLPDWANDPYLNHYGPSSKASGVCPSIVTFASCRGGSFGSSVITNAQFKTAIVCFLHRR